jgi:hypothetical protein
VAVWGDRSQTVTRRAAGSARETTLRALPLLPPRGEFRKVEPVTTPESAACTTHRTPASGAIAIRDFLWTTLWTAKWVLRPLRLPRLVPQ